MKSTACTCAAPASASARVKRPMPAPSSSTRRPASDGGSSPAQPDQRSQRTAAPGSGHSSAGYRGCAGRIDSRRTRAGYRGCAGRAATDRGTAQRTHDLRPLGCVELPRFRVQHHGLQRRLGGVLRPVRFLGARDSAARQPPSVAQGSPRRTSRPRPRARAPTDSVTSERASKCAAVRHARRRARSPGRRMQCRCAAAREAAASRTMAARSSSGGCWAPLSASVAALACEAAAEAAGSAAAASIPVLARAQTERRRPAQAREGRVGFARLAEGLAAARCSLWSAPSGDDRRCPARGLGDDSSATCACVSHSQMRNASSWCGSSSPCRAQRRQQEPAADEPANCRAAGNASDPLAA